MSNARVGARPSRADLERSGPSGPFQPAQRHVASFLWDCNCAGVLETGPTTAAVLPVRRHFGRAGGTVWREQEHPGRP